MPHDAFLKAIIANPDDDLPRLVYADYLDETSAADRAEFIRVQCQLAKLEEHEPLFRELEDREHALLAANEKKWFQSQRGLSEWVWRRGFVDDATDREIVTAEVEELFDTQPISTWRTIYLRDRPRDLVLQELPDRSLAQVRHFDLSNSFWLPAEFDRRIAAIDCPQFQSFDLSDILDPIPTLRAALQNHAGRALEKLELGNRMRVDYEPAMAQKPLLEFLNRNPVAQLGLQGREISTADLVQLVSSANAAGLRRLDISDNPVGADAYRAFEQAQPAMRLESLDVSSTPLAGISLEPLLNTRVLESLTKLEINGCGSARRNMDVLARSRFWTQATQLRAHSGTVPASTLEPLCQSHGPPALRLLDLADNYLRAEGVQLLSEAPWVDSLTWLALTANYLDNEACAVLAQSGRYRQLRTLHLAHNNIRQESGDGEQITDAGALALTESESLSNLRLLTLSQTGITHRAVYSVLNAPYWRLSGLGIAGCNLKAQTVQILAESPRLARLHWLDLSGNPLFGGDRLRPLAESPYLSPLCELDCGGLDIAPDVQAIFRERLGVRFGY